MTFRKLLLALLPALFLSASTRAAHAAPLDALSSGFTSPPASAKPHTWWHWMNGNVSREGITADLEAMKRVGVGGAQIFTVDTGIPAGPVKFMSPDYRALVKHAISEAQRLGLEITLHNAAGWSSSGGPWISPDIAMQKVVTSETQVSGPARIERVLAQPETRNNYYRDIAVLAFPTSQNPLRIENLKSKADYERGDSPEPSGDSAPADRVVSRANIVELSSRVLASGALTWDAPAGDWTILRIGSTPTGETNHPAPPEGLGLESDKLSRAATDAHFAGMMQKIIDDVGPLAGKSLNNSLIDSYEVGAQNWTPLFREEFRKRRGYDLLPYLPVLSGRVVESPQLSERFLWDFRRTIADLFAENYYDRFGELAHARGLLFSTEPYGNGPFDDLRIGAKADIPMGEFWIGGAAAETAKLASSVAHINGRKFVGAEAFTANPDRAGWRSDPYSLKALGDRMYCAGINRFIFHRYAQQPWLNRFPGMTMGPFGLHFERTNTWWNQGAAWLQYLARCQYLLQQGKFVADVLYFNGENTPNTMRTDGGAPPFGYDYDGCDVGTLMRLSVRNGRLFLPNGMSYRVLALPQSRTMRPATLRKIRQLLFDGATVVGALPQSSPSLENYPQADAEIAAMTREISANVEGKNGLAFGKGRLFSTQPVREVLETLQRTQGIGPDFSYASTRNNARLNYIHRVADGADIYFVSNQRSASQQADCTFRVAGKAPELWHPDSGKIERAPLYTQRGGLTTVPLQLDPAGSVFVVFRRATNAAHLTTISRSGQAASQPNTPKLEIRRAVYEAVDGTPGTLDVTAQLEKLVRDNTLNLQVENSLFNSDPAPNHVKRLRLEYSLGGKTFTQVADEHEEIELPSSDGRAALVPFEWGVSRRGETELRVWQPGEHSLQTANGKTRRISVKSVPAPQEIGGAWDVRFPPNWGAPAKVTFPQLMSWTQNEVSGVRYFSGTATYTKTVNIAPPLLQRNRALFLDLGRVQNLARVRFNGHDFGVLWKPPFRVDISDVARAGANTLEVEITNLWPNRLIGDEQLPDDREWNGDQLARWPQWLLEGKPSPTGRFTFTTWRHWRRDSPLLESGLLGPVMLRAAERILVK